MTLETASPPQIIVNYRDVLLDMRSEILIKMMMIVAGFSLAGAYLTLLEKPFPFDKFMLFSSLSLAIYLLHRVHVHHTNIARYTLVITLHIFLFVGAVVIQDNWVALLSVPLVLMSGLLVSNSSIVSAVVSCIVIGTLNLSGVLDVSMDILLLLIGIMLSMTLTTISTFYVTVSWYSAMHKRADTLLQQARDRRAELLYALKSLDTAYVTQRRMHDQLVYARQKANEARLMKERFAANISHELRTPLNLIMGFSEIMYLQPEVYGDIHFSPRFVRDVYQIYGNSKYLLGLIDDILDLSHIEMSGFGISFAQTDMNEFIRSSVEFMQNLFHDGDVELILDIQSELPYMEIDRTRMRQILLNLLTNAQRFTEQGHVIVRVYTDDQNFILQVIDTGKGIPADQIKHVFDEFYQVDYSLSRSHGGAGLGLAITRHFVEAHEGRVEVSSEVGAGTVFTVSLPIITTHQALANRSSDELFSTVQNKPYVVVMDADETVVTMLTRFLEDYIIVPVPSNEKFEDTIQRIQPLAVINNQQQANKLERPMLIDNILMIECALPSTRWFVDQLGVLDCLPKPISPEMLHNYIRRLAQIETILIVDDDMGFVQLVQRVIEMLPQPYQILRAYDGLRALEIVEQQRPDLILLDIAMPELNGFEVITALQDNPNTTDIPIILLTATRYVESEFENNTSLSIHKASGLNTSEVLTSIKSLLKAMA